MDETRPFLCARCGKPLGAYEVGVHAACSLPEGGAPRPPRAQGDVVCDHYRLEDVLGKGGFGEVWLARDVGEIPEAERKGGGTAPNEARRVVNQSSEVQARFAAMSKKEREEQGRKMQAGVADEGKGRDQRGDNAEPPDDQREASPGLLFAIKFNKLRDVSTPEGRDALERFRHERRQLARLRDEHIARVRDSHSEDGGEPVLIMEYVDGEHLDRYCDRNKLPVRARMAIVLDACRGMYHAHFCGVEHRDLKPSNILVSEVYRPQMEPQPEPKVIDFGLASDSKRKRERWLRGESGGFAGTLGYASPAQLRGDEEPFGKPDVYALGCIIYAMVTGVPPLGRETLETYSQCPGVDSLTQIAAMKPPTMAERLATLSAIQIKELAANRSCSPAQLKRHADSDLFGSRDLSAIVASALEPDSEKRISLGALMSALEDYLAHRVCHLRPRTWREVSAKFLRRNAGAVAAGTLVAAALVSGTAVSLWQNHRAQLARALAETRQQELAVKDAEQTRYLKQASLSDARSAVLRAREAELQGNNDAWAQAIAQLSRAIRFDPTNQAASQAIANYLILSQHTPRRRHLVIPVPDSSDIAFSFDSRTLHIARKGAPPMAWNVSARHESPAPFSGATDITAIDSNPRHPALTITTHQDGSRKVWLDDAATCLGAVLTGETKLQDVTFAGPNHLLVLRENGAVALLPARRPADGATVLSFGEPAKKICASIDGRWGAAALESGAFALVDLQSKAVKRLPLPEKKDEYTRSTEVFAFAEGNVLLAGSSRMWLRWSGQEVGEWKLLPKGDMGGLEITLNPNRDMLAAISLGNEFHELGQRSIGMLETAEVRRVEDLDNPGRLLRLRPNDGNIQTIAFAPFFNIFAVSTDVGLLVTWEGKDKLGAPLRVDPTVQKILFSPDSRWIALQHTDHVTICEARDRGPVITCPNAKPGGVSLIPFDLKEEEGSDEALFLSASKQLAVFNRASDDARSMTLSLRTLPSAALVERRKTRSMPLDAEAEVYPVPGRDWLRLTFPKTAPNRLALLDPDRGPQPFWEAEAENQLGPVTFAIDAPAMLSLHRTKYEPAPKEGLRSLRIDDDENPEAYWADRSGGRAYVWDLGSSATAPVLLPESDRPTSIPTVGAMSRDGRFAAVGNEDGTVLIWKKSSEWQLCGERKLPGKVTELLFSANGQHLVATAEEKSSSKTISRLSTAQAKAGAGDELTVKTERLLAIQQTPSGIIAVIEQETSAEIIHLESGRRISLPGPKRGASDCVFSGDGKRFCWQTGKQVIEIRETADGALVGEPIDLPAPPTSFDWSPDGHFLHILVGGVGQPSLGFVLNADSGLVVSPLLTEGERGASVQFGPKGDCLLVKDRLLRVFPFCTPLERMPPNFAEVYTGWRNQSGAVASWIPDLEWWKLRVELDETLAGLPEGSFWREADRWLRQPYFERGPFNEPSAALESILTAFMGNDVDQLDKVRAYTRWDPGHPLLALQGLRFMEPEDREKQWVLVKRLIARAAAPETFLTAASVGLELNWPDLPFCSEAISRAEALSAPAERLQPLRARLAERQRQLQDVAVFQPKQGDGPPELREKARRLMALGCLPEALSTWRRLIDNFGSNGRNMLGGLIPNGELEAGDFLDAASTAGGLRRNKVLEDLVNRGRQLVHEPSFRLEMAKRLLACDHAIFAANLLRSDLNLRGDGPSGRELRLWLSIAEWQAGERDDAVKTFQSAMKTDQNGTAATPDTTSASAWSPEYSRILEQIRNAASRETPGSPSK